MNDDPRPTLEEAGRRPAPPPDPAFADRLETRLLAVAGTATPPPGPGRPRRPRPRAWLVLAGVTIGALAVAVLLVSTPPGPASTPELADAVNVEVALRDGTILEDPDGLRLPDGAVVTVGEGGSARIGDTVLGPGDMAMIEQGAVRVERERPEGVVPGTAAATTTRPTAPRTAVVPGRTSTPRAPRPTPTAPPTSQPSDAPAPTPVVRPSPTPPPATPAPLATPAPPTATPTPSATPTLLTARPRLRARFLAAREKVAVTWTATRRAHTYVLLITRSRAGPAADPVYPGSAVLGVFTKAPAVPLRFRVRVRVVEVRLLVVALGKDGREVSRSRIVVVPTGGGAVVTTAGE